MLMYERCLWLFVFEGAAGMFNFSRPAGMFYSWRRRHVLLTLSFDFTAVIAFTAVDFSNLAVKVANRTGAFSGPVCPCLEPLVRFPLVFAFEFTAVDVMILTLLVFTGNCEISVFQIDCTRLLVQVHPRKCIKIRSQYELKITINIMLLSWASFYPDHPDSDIFFFIGNRETSVFQLACTRLPVQGHPRKCNLIRSQ